MKPNRYMLLFAFLAVCLSLSCSQTANDSFQVIAQTATPTYFPLITNGWPTYPSFGVAINNLAYLPEAASAGTYWVHYNGLLWSDIQPTGPSEYLWDNVSALETRLIEASEAGLEVILVVRSTPTWAQKYSGIYCGPMKSDNFDEFASFMAQVVERYSRPPYNVTFYEIWNEPDSFLDDDYPEKPWGCWGDRDDPYYGGGYYASMLQAVYPAIKMANPSAQVVLGGLLLGCDPRQPGAQGYCEDTTSAKPSLFIKGILANDGGNYFDFYNFHGYNFYSNISTAIQTEKSVGGWVANGGQIEGKLDYLLELQATYESYKPSFVTEAGLLFDHTPTIEFQEEKADYVVYLYTRNLARGIAGTTWYLLESPGWRNSGLLQDPDRAYAAYAFLIEELDGYDYNQDLSLGTGIIAFEFEKSEYLWVLFSEDGSEKSISTPAGVSGVYDLYGNSIPYAEGTITFSRPIYIEFSP